MARVSSRVELVKKTKWEHTCPGCRDPIPQGSPALVLITEGVDNNDEHFKNFDHFHNLSHYNAWRQSIQQE